MLVSRAVKDEVPIQEKRNRNSYGCRDGTGEIAVHNCPSDHLHDNANSVDKAEDQDESHEVAPSWISENKMTVELEPGQHPEGASNHCCQGEMATQTQG